jgi:putative transposase
VSVYRIISAERASFPVSVMCDVLEVSRSGFHGWERRAPSDRALSDVWLTERIKEIHERARGVYGSRRVQAELRLGQGIEVSRKRVRRLMRAAGISGLVRVKRGRTTIRVPGVRVADDLVERQFSPAAPNVLWVADLTYLRTWEGWLYLAAVQDAYSRMIVGWSMAEHMRAELVVDAPRAASRDSSVVSSSMLQCYDAVVKCVKQTGTGTAACATYGLETITFGGSCVPARSNAAPKKAGLASSIRA